MSLTAVLTGTFSNPELRFQFPWGARMPKGGDAQDWIKNKVPSRRFDRSTKIWYITGTGENPDKFFARHGIDVDYSEASGSLAGLDSLEPLWRPLVKQSSRFSSNALVRHRLAGYDRVAGLLGPGAAWDKAAGRFTVSLSDLITPDGNKKRGLIMDDDTYEAAVACLQTSSIPDRVRRAARELAASTGVEKGDKEQKTVSARTRKLIDVVAEHTGYLPDWFGMELYPFQLAGAYAIMGGHRALCDAPGLGKCVVPETRILANGAYTPIGRLWDEHAAVTAPRPDYDGVGEIIELDAGQLTVQALNEDVTASRTVSASHLYRERITAPVKTIRTASGAEITATLPHKFLTAAGWVPGINPGDLIAVPADGELLPVRWTKVTSVELSDYDGWVYDLTVPDGHNYIAEGLWCHNTRQSLAAAAIHGPDRVLIVVPPLVVANFASEANIALGPYFAKDRKVHGTAGIDLTAVKGKKGKTKKAPEFPPYIVPIRAGRKVPPLPERGIVVVADSLLGRRPELLDELVAWNPTAVLFDEIHRARTYAGQRATADRNLACNIDGLRVAMTGTPFLAKPAEGANMLAIAGVLDPVFGGASAFIERYCTQNFFGAWLPNRAMLPELEQRLTAHCWVRRNKGDVLKQLPRKLRSLRVVDIDPRGFQEAHAALYDKIGEWVEEMREEGTEITRDLIKTYARTHIELITPLRAAAGVAKVPPAIEIVREWMEMTTEIREDGTRHYTRPLTVWVHHKPVMEALVAAIPPDLAGVGFIHGGVPEHKRQPVADRLQNGEIGVIFCSIGAAGFGINLTNSSDAIFVETDWTPANISQAEDRNNRIGQKNTCMVTTLMAVNTLDPHMRAILRNKAGDLDVMMPGADNNVTVMTAELNEDTNAYEVLTEEDRSLEKEFHSLADIIERITVDVVEGSRPSRRAAA